MTFLAGSPSLNRMIVGMLMTPYLLATPGFSSTLTLPISSTIGPTMRHGLHHGAQKSTFIGVANAFSEVVPGHMHLRSVVEAVKAGVRGAGGVPLEFGVMGICDGLAMNHLGMNYSLPSREIIADTVESMTTAHAFDALVLVPTCDKIVPGMLMAAMRLNVPAIMVGGGPMLAGHLDGRTIYLNSVFEAVGRHQAGTLDDQGLKANALAADASLGCSTNTVLYLAAIATEAGLEFDLRRINEVAARVPHICKLLDKRSSPARAALGTVGWRRKVLGHSADKGV